MVFMNEKSLKKIGKGQTEEIWKLAPHRRSNFLLLRNSKPWLQLLLFLNKAYLPAPEFPAALEESNKNETIVEKN